jgi:DNA-binding PucR family transcriptional regulator
VTEQLFSEFGWLPEHRYFCISLKMAALDLENMTVRFVCRHIENMLGHSCAFQYENNITIFVNLTRFGGGIDDAMEKIVYFLRDSFLKAGLSNEFVGFQHIRQYYRQAVITLEVGNRRRPFQWIHRFDEIALDYLLEQSKGELPGEIVCCRKIMELKEFDEEHNTDYYHTLKLYVKNNLNAVQTAKGLYIHRSTFLYRMEKIKEIIHLDLEDFDTLLYVMMTFRLMEQKEA